jgi:transposase InsO family protein
VERSHDIDEIEFYQPLEYTDDADLNKKLAEWENYYSFHRPHLSLRGKSP